MQPTGKEQHDASSASSTEDRFRHVQFLSQPAFAPRRTFRPRCVSQRAGEDRSKPPCQETEPTLEPEAAEFIEWLLRGAGVDARCYRPKPLARRLPACLRALRARSVAQARLRIDRNPGLSSVAVNALLIGVTQFFREPEAFSFLENEAFDWLLANRAGLHVWSAGCSDGAELYSVAIMLARRGKLCDSTLLGTDCRADAIRDACAGWYDADRMGSMDKAVRRTHFVPCNGGWQVREDLRRATHWHVGDVLQGVPEPGRPWDLVLCRNLAIYLEPPASARLWSVVADSLGAGGILVTGKAEQPPRASPLVRLTRSVYQKQG